MLPFGGLDCGAAVADVRRDDMLTIQDDPLTFPGRLNVYQHLAVVDLVDLVVHCLPVVLKVARQVSRL